MLLPFALLATPAMPPPLLIVPNVLEPNVLFFVAGTGVAPCCRNELFTAFNAEAAGLFGSAFAPAPPLFGAPGFAPCAPEACLALPFAGCPSAGAGTGKGSASESSGLAFWPPGMVSLGVAGGRRCAPYNCAAVGSGGAFGSVVSSFD